MTETDERHQVGTLGPVTRVMADLATKKRLELDQRILADPELRAPIFEAARDITSCLLRLCDLLILHEEPLTRGGSDVAAVPLTQQVKNLSHLIGLMGYSTDELADILLEISSTATAIIGYIDGRLSNVEGPQPDKWDWRDNLLNVKSSFATVTAKVHDFQIENNIHKAAAAVEQAQQAAIASREAAGTTADITLGSYYGSIASEESASAKSFRRGAIACLVIGVAIAAWIAAVIITDHEEGVSSQLFKLAACLPVLGVAFYLSHESTSHRMVARRAKEVEVRLQTMEAFLAPLERDQKIILRVKVGESILSGPLNLSAGTDKQAVDAQAIIEKLIDKA